jgi:hypothetical protein
LLCSFFIYGVFARGLQSAVNQIPTYLGGTMLKRHRTLFTCLLTLLVAVAFSFAIPAAGQQKSSAKKTVADKAQKGRGGGADDNIKNDSDKNDPNSTAPAPPSKGGPKGRAGLCAVTADNYTPWIIKVYVDGDYRGAVGRYDELSVLAISGTTRVYARADFTDGTVKTWGPRTFYCESGESYTWKLNRD